jgi:hypothetical protein
MADTGQRATLIYVAILVATVATTLALAFLLIPESARGERFNLALGFIIFGELLASSYVIWIENREDPGNRGLPYHLGISYVVVTYCVGVLALAGISATGISFDWLLALSVVWNFLLLVTFLVVARGAGFVAEIDTRRSDRQGFMIALRQEMSAVRDLAHSSSDETLRETISVFDSVEEELAYATTESLPGADALDSQLQTGLQSIRESLERGREAATSSDPPESTPVGAGQEGSGEGEASATGSSVVAARVSKELEEMKRVLKRRQEVLKQLQ